jgi:hypothetical protein
VSFRANLFNDTLRTDKTTAKHFETGVALHVLIYSLIQGGSEGNLAIFDHFLE